MARSTAKTSLPNGASAGAQRCSVLGTLTVVGDFWSLGVLRCAVYGMRRFAEFERELGVATNVLTNRLSNLVEARVLERVEYQTNPSRHEYVLTEAGRELAPVILALKQWGDRHVQSDGAWTEIRHRGCGTPLQVTSYCPACGEPSAPDEAEVAWIREPVPERSTEVEARRDSGRPQ